MRAVNLIPHEQRSGTSVGVGRSQGGAYAVLVLVAGVALLALLYGRADHQIASRRAQSASLAAQAQQAQAAAERLAPYTSFVAQREQRVQAVETLVNSRFDWAHVFHEIGRVLPRDVSVSSLTGTIGASTAATASTSSSTPSSPSASATPVSSTTPPGSVPTFSIAGCATSQPAVALMLQRLRLIDGVDEVTLGSSTAAAASGSSSGSGTCTADGPTFTATVSFDPLPSTTAVAAATKAATKTVSDAASAHSAPAAPTTSGVKR
jgi:Tfp pilus assembly protein PilN